MLPSYYHPGKEEPIASVQSGLWPGLDFIGASVPLPEFASGLCPQLLMGREEVEYLKSSPIWVFKDCFDMLPRRSWQMVIFNLRQVWRNEC